MSLDNRSTTVEQWIHETGWLLLGAEQCVDASLSKCPYESNAELRQAREKGRLVARALTSLNMKVASLRTAIEVQLQEQDSGVSDPRARANGQ
jgi:hypothetical protein